MKIGVFNEKLNKIDGNIYMVEEKVDLTGGVYNAPLQHDNINTSTLSVYTGPKLTGIKIQSYTLSTPSLTPWKQMIRIYANAPTVYISYETEGDTVEAEDVNRLQEELVFTQNAVNEEVNRATESEQNITKDLTKEVVRAKIAEQEVADDLTKEVSRAKESDQVISRNIIAEASRAKIAEEANANNLTAEITRAKAAEEANINYVNTEITKRYTKDQTYSRQEVLDRIEELIGTAPETLDTFQEIAKALGEDPNFAATITKILAGKVDKEEGRGLSVNDYSNTEKATLADANSKKHTHSNKATIDKLTETLLTRWTESYDKRHEHENKGILDTISQTLVDQWNAAHVHISDTVRHVTEEEREAWNTVSDKVETVAGKGLSTNDYTNGEKNKLAGVALGAEVNVQADWNVSDSTADAFIKNKPSSLPANGGSSDRLSNAVLIADYNTFVPIKVSQGSVTPVRANSSAKSPWINTTSGFLIQSNSTDSWHLLIFRSGGDGWAYRSFYNNEWGSWKIWTTFDGKYSSLAGKPNKVSAFENDTGYITAADVDTSQNHLHANKSALDKITQALLDHWNAAFTHVSDKNNPHKVTVEQVGAAARGHKHKKNDITDFPSALPANGGDSDTVSGYSVNTNVPAGAKFTDTVYNHPSSGVTAGTYKSVAVNTEGHVTSGTNPTTLSGYGITDAASKIHSHDSTYLKRTGLTWDDLKGV